MGVEGWGKGRGRGREEGEGERVGGGTLWCCSCQG